MPSSVVVLHPQANLRHAAAEEAQRQWALCAPAIAGQPRIRISRDGGKSYPRRTERVMDTSHPHAPAAVRVYDEDGFTRCLALDFDTSRHGQAQVDRDAATAARIVAGHGGHVLADQSPNGGRHVYVLFEDRISFDAARQFTRELALRLPSLDASPMYGRTDGVIRPPGSPHKSGGFQVLTVSLGDAMAAISTRNPARVWAGLLEYVESTPAPHGQPAQAGGNAPITAIGQGQDYITAAEALPPQRATVRDLPHDWAHMAATGEWDRNRWPSASEARLALLRAIARHGWTFPMITARIEQGHWAGLMSFYVTKYGRSQARRIMAREWLKTGTVITPTELANNFNTRGPLTQPGTTGPTSEYQQIREWWTVLKSIETRRWTGRESISLRLVLRAVGAAAQVAGTIRPAFGVRSLALASGLDYSTVALCLQRLRAETDPVLIRTRQGRGLEADEYELRIPDAHHGLRELRWLPGRISGVHPAFQALPLPAPLIWEHISDAPITAFDLARMLGLSLRCVQLVLKEMAAAGLVTATAAGWVAGPTGLSTAATDSGARDLHEVRRVRFRRQRELWRQRVALWLGSMPGMGAMPLLEAPPPGSHPLDEEDREPGSTID
jgi:hypothetical protein